MKYDTKSPLDSGEPKPETLRIKVPKDRPITVRLDSENRAKFDKLAAARGMGPSTFTRSILMKIIKIADADGAIVSVTAEIDKSSLIDLMSSE